MDRDGGNIQSFSCRFKEDALFVGNCFNGPPSRVMGKDLDRAASKRMSSFQAEVHAARNRSMNAKPSHFTKYTISFKNQPPQYHHMKDPLAKTTGYLTKNTVR